MAGALDIISSIASGLSLFACMWLFKTYNHVHPRRKSTPLRMILILGISDFIQALAYFILLTVRTFLPLCEVVQYVASFSTLYSLFWSSTLALFSAKAIKSTQEAQPKMNRFFAYAMVICAVLSAILPLPILVNFKGAGYSGPDGTDACTFHFTNSASPAIVILNILLIQVGPHLVAIGTTIVSYIRVGSALKTTSSHVLKHWMINPKYLMWYPISQLVLYVPYLVAVGFYAFGSSPVFLEGLWRVCIRLSGFVNSMVYLKMRRQIKKSNTKDAKVPEEAIETKEPLLEDTVCGSVLSHL